jgi:opacity protein-like surface antigen
MRSHIHPERNLLERSTVRILATIFFLLTVLTLSSSSALGQCQIGFRPGSSIADGSIDGTQGTKWNDASILRSGDPCMSFLPDWDQATMSGGGHAAPTISQMVRVLSKRDTTALYIAFDVTDRTRDRRDPGNIGSALAVGERIILQFDSDNGHGASLNNDFRIDVTHRWQVSGSDITLIAPTYSDSSGAAGGLCATASFAPLAFPGGAGGIQIKARLTGTGYFIEFKVPLNKINNPTNDIGFAFAVINDLGFHDGDGNDDATGISFPTALPIVNDTNPLFPECQWVIPSQWGLGFFTTGLDDVTISRLPDWWNSSAVNVFACGAPNYIYYPGHPCRVSMKATLTNSSANNQTRNLLYLWAEHGSNPVVWHVIDLQKNVTVPPGTNVMPTSGELSDPSIKNKTTHPCVRVYILPSTFRVDFDESMILAINSQTQLDTMVMKYGLQDQHNAQKNITREATINDCPDSGCRISRNAVPGMPSSANVEALLSSRLPDGIAGYDTAADSSLSQDSSSDATTLRLVNAGFVMPAASLPQTAARPLISTTGHPILLSGDEAREFGRDNVIVQVRAFGFSKRRPGSSSYNFIEGLGGVMHLFPVSMFRERKEVPFELNVGNPGTFPRTIFLVVDFYVPPGTLTGVTVDMDSGEKEFQPDETKVARGTVKIGTRQPPSFKRWGLSLHAGLSIPHGDFNTFFNPGPNFGFDLEYRITPTFSLEGIYGFHRFNGDTLGPFRLSDVTLHQFSVNGKVYGSSSPVRPFFNFGGGAYVFTPGANTHGGLNVGGGFQFDVTPTFAVDAMYNFHNVFTSGSNTQFSTVQGGVRFRF